MSCVHWITVTVPEGSCVKIAALTLHGPKLLEAETPAPLPSLSGAPFDRVTRSNLTEKTFV